jgi:hypothetical protein
MPKYDAEEEKRLAICVSILEKYAELKLLKLAREHRVSYDKLRRRLRNIPSQRANGPQQEVIAYPR